MITLNALFARLAARLARPALTDLPALDPTAPFVAAEGLPADLLGTPAIDDALRGPRGAWIEGPFVRDAGTLQVRW